jgi:hypothetical protein
MFHSRKVCCYSYRIINPKEDKYLKIFIQSEYLKTIPAWVLSVIYENTTSIILVMKTLMVFSHRLV